MITNNPMQLKAFIKKMLTEKNISAQLVMQNYMMERLLERISLSKYKVNFILQPTFPKSITMVELFPKKGIAPSVFLLLHQ